MFDRHILNRRHFLGLGVLGGLSTLGLPLPTVQAAEGRRRAKAKNVLVIYEQGGLSHMDTWDPKPDVLAEHRSPFKPIATTVPGMQFTELLSRRRPGWRQVGGRPLDAPREGRRRRPPQRHAVRALRLAPRRLHRDAGHRLDRGTRGRVRVQISAAVHHGAGQPRAGSRDAHRLPARVHPGLQDRRPRPLGPELENQRPAAARRISRSAIRRAAATCWRH